MFERPDSKLVTGVALDPRDARFAEEVGSYEHEYSDPLLLSRSCSPVTCITVQPRFPLSEYSPPHTTNTISVEESKEERKEDTDATVVHSAHSAATLQQLFLVGRVDGSVDLFDVGITVPLFTWRPAEHRGLAKEGNNNNNKNNPLNVTPAAITRVQWLSRHPSCFFACDSAGYLYYYDLLQNKDVPCYVVSQPETCFSATSSTHAFSNSLSSATSSTAAGLYLLSARLGTVSGGGGEEKCDDREKNPALWVRPLHPYLGQQNTSMDRESPKAKQGEEEERRPLEEAIWQEECRLLLGCLTPWVASNTMPSVATVFSRGT